MRQIFFLALAAALTFGAAQGASAASSGKLAVKVSQSKFISQSDVQRSGGYLLSIPGHGDVRIVGVSATRQGNKKCLVEKASLRNLIANRLKTGTPTSAAVTVKLKASTGGNCPADTICCSGGGNNCAVDVVIVQQPSGG